MDVIIRGLKYYCKKCGYGARLKTVFKEQHPEEHERWLRSKKKKED